MDLTYPQGATPLDPGVAAGLLPKHITTQADLNAWEEANILQGEQWVTRQTKRDLLTEGFVRFHHQLVWIHPFPNGNGRHARLLAGTLAMRLGPSTLYMGQCVARQHRRCQSPLPACSAGCRCRKHGWVDRVCAQLEQRALRI